MIDPLSGLDWMFLAPLHSESLPWGGQSFVTQRGPEQSLEFLHQTSLRSTYLGLVNLMKQQGPLYASVS